jgi:hypothetical protein
VQTSGVEQILALRRPLKGCEIVTPVAGRGVYARLKKLELLAQVGKVRSRQAATVHRVGLAVQRDLSDGGAGEVE